MKYRAILVDPGNTTPERPIQTFSNSMESIKEWAYGSKEGGLERPKGVLEAPGVSEDAAVWVYVMQETKCALLTKKGKPE